MGIHNSFYFSVCLEFFIMKYWKKKTKKTTDNNKIKLKKKKKAIKLNMCSIDNAQNSIKGRK